MNTMKRISGTLFLACCLLLHSGTESRAQIPTTDIANLAEAITDALREEISERISAGHLDRGNEKLEKANKLSQERLDEMRDEFKKNYERIESYISKGENARQIAQAYQQAYNSYESLTSYLKYCKDNKLISAQSVRSIEGWSKSIYQQVEHANNMVADLFNKSNPMSQEGRLQQTSQRKEEMEDANDVLTERLHKEASTTIYSLLAQGTSNVLAGATGMAPTESNEYAAAIDGFVKETIDKMNTGNDITMDDAQAVSSGSSTVKSVFGFVEIIIAVLAVLFIPIAYARRGKDPQHQDALWKVFVGLLASLLLLELIKVCVFGGFFKMTLIDF